jgi:hypothetical protein
MQLQNNRFHKHTNLVVDERANLLLLHYLVSISKGLTSDEGLHPDSVNLIPNLNFLLKLV